MLFVAGWVSALQGWLDLIGDLAKTRAVFYLETREKSSARIDRKALTRQDFSISRIADDLIVAAGSLPVDTKRIVLMGSSLGATAILEAMKQGRLQPHSAFLIGPNARFRFPWWGSFVVYLPVAAFHPTQILIRWYLRTFRVDVKREPEQMQRYDETIKQAEPLRLKLSAQAVRRYEVWPGLASIERPVAVAYAHSDSLHGAEEMNRLGKALPKAVMVPCPSNRFMHSAKLTPKLDEWLAE